jgi:hypothetical protein
LVDVDGRSGHTEDRCGCTVFERIVNAVHKELPEAKFAFNNSIEKTREAVDRVLASEENS